MMDTEGFNRLMERGTIEVAPLAYMRGRTLNDSFIILDEAQNTTPEQMKMFLTRLGFGSKAVVTGDVTQIDLPSGSRSGLVVVEEILEGIEELEFVHLGARDVVRHKIVQDIVEAYRVFGERRRRGRRRGRAAGRRRPPRRGRGRAAPARLRAGNRSAGVRPTATPARRRPGAALARCAIARRRGRTGGELTLSFVDATEMSRPARPLHGRTGPDRRAVVPDGRGRAAR